MTKNSAEVRLACVFTASDPSYRTRLLQLMTDICDGKYATQIQEALNV